METVVGVGWDDHVVDPDRRTEADLPADLPADAASDGVQGSLLDAVRSTVRTATTKPLEPLASERPVARVAVDVPLPHLDRPFDYAVPDTMSETARPGTRVRVRFAGRLVNGFVLERVGESHHTGTLARLQRAVSPEVVLTPEILTLARTVADRGAGVLADVLRLAVPPRHAAAESKPSVEPAEWPDPPPTSGPWDSYAHGPAFVRALADRKDPRAVWTALPGDEWPQAVAIAARATLAAGRGVVVVVADARDVARVSEALAEVLGDGRHLELTADLGPAERYRRFLALSRGAVRCVVGTRAAQFAPVHDLGLAVVWDDGDDLHAEPHAPYPHVREVLRERASLEGAGFLVGGFAMTAEGRLLIDTADAHAVAPSRATVRASAPAVRAAGDDVELARDAAAATARLPQLAWRTAREGLEHGPVLVQVPRRGYVPSLACVRCRTPARCRTCAGPLALTSGHAVPYCRWCGRPAGQFSCRECGATRLRASVTGAGRTAEELGRAFPGTAVRTSGRDEVLATVGQQPALVVATPGAEPVAEGGYAAALLLDGWALLDRADLRAGEEALRRWFAAAALVRPASAGGRVVIMADATHRSVQAFVRWDPSGAADRELADRRELHFPPVASVAEITGSAPAVAELLAELEDAVMLPTSAEVLGPQPYRSSQKAAHSTDDEERVRTLIRVPRSQAAALAQGLAAVQATRSARKAPEPVRVRIDPLDLG